MLTSILLIPLSNAIYAAGDAAAGEKKAAACTSCHGIDGKGSPATPSVISGMNIGKFSKSLQAYKTGERKHAMMEMFTKNLSDQDIADLAAYYATK